MRHKARGILVIELAYALPILLLFILLSIEVARFFWTQHWLNYNLHEAARAASLNPGRGVQQRLTEQLVAGDILLSARSVTVTERSIDWINNANGRVVRYTATAELDFFMMPIRQFTLSSVTWLAQNENVME